MIEMGIPTAALKRLETAATEAGRKLEQEVAVAVNKTAKYAQKEINKDIRQELATNKKAVDKAIRPGRKATKTNQGTTVTIVRGRRIPLKEFGARQTKAGTSYRISKSQGRRTAPGAFMGPKPGAVSVRLNGHVFSRVGKARLPIRKLKGPSPLGVFVRQRLTAPTKKKVRRELQKQVENRIRYNVLKTSGAI